MVGNFSSECQLVLRLLARSKNVLLAGAPGTGKSKLLSEVALAFESLSGVTSAGDVPRLNPVKGIPIPPVTGSTRDSPAPTKVDRKVFRTVFHQNSKYRDFVSGITPALNKQAGGPDFTVVKGTLYRASEHAKSANGAALLIIDEINRGPAVQVFGALADALNDADAQLTVLWCFRESDATGIESGNREFLERMNAAITSGQLHLYGGINCHTLFGDL